MLKRPEVTFSKTKRERLRFAYEEAAKSGDPETTFWFEGVEYKVGYTAELLAWLDERLGKANQWTSPVPTMCDMDASPIIDEFIDGKTMMGPWACMCPSCWDTFGVGQLGTGMGQRYKRRPDGKNWVKIGG